LDSRINLGHFLVGGSWWSLFRNTTRRCTYKRFI